MKKFLLGVLLATSLLLGSGAAPVPAYASSTDAARQEVCQGVSGTGTNCGNGGADLTGIIRAILQVLSIIAGVAAVIMIIIGGLKYITSNGDSNNVASAKNTIIYAIVGLIVVAMAQFIVRFVLSNAR